MTDIASKIKRVLIKDATWEDFVNQFGLPRTRRVSEGAVLPHSDDIVAELEGLRHFVDNFNTNTKIALRSGDTYRQLQEADIFTTRKDNWMFGYALEEYPTFFKRKVYIKCMDAHINEVPEDERRVVVTSVFKACLDVGQGEIEIYLTDPNTLLITQEFSPIFLTERSPGVIVPGGVGKA